MPHVTTGIQGAELLVVGGDLDALQDAFGRHDLVRAHHQQHPVGGEYTVFGEHVEQAVPGEERFGERGQVLDGLVLRVRPPGGELERVRGLAGALAAGSLVNVFAAGGVGVVLGERAVADDEQLHVLEEAGAGPKAVALVAADLVERFTDVDPAPLQLDVHHRQPVHQHGDVIPGGARRTTLHLSTVTLIDLVLVDDLKPVVVNVGLVDEQHILGAAVVAFQKLNVVFLDANRLFGDAIVGPCDAFDEELRPLGIRELDAVEPLKLRAQVCNQLCFAHDGQVLVGLALQQPDELPL